MFRRKKKKGVDFEEQVSASKYKVVFDCLTDIAKLDANKTGPDGKSVFDADSTIRLIRMKAKTALAFVKSLDEPDDNKD